MPDQEDEELGGLREIENDDVEEDFEPPQKSSNTLMIVLLSVVVFAALFLFFRGGNEESEDQVNLEPEASLVQPAPKNEIGDSIVLPKEEAFKNMVVEEPPPGEIVIRSEPNEIKSIPPVADKLLPNLEDDKRFSNPPDMEPVFGTLKPEPARPPRPEAPPIKIEAPKKVEAPKKPAQAKQVIPAAPPKKEKSKTKIEVAALGPYTLQLGAFKAQSGANLLVARLKKAGYNAYIDENGNRLFRVRIGAYKSRSEAGEVGDQIRKSEGLDSIVVTR